MPLTKLRPLTPKEVHVAIAVLGCVKTLIDDRLASHARNSLTYRELHSLELKIEKLRQSVGEK